MERKICLLWFLSIWKNRRRCLLFVCNKLKFCYTMGWSWLFACYRPVMFMFSKRARALTLTTPNLFRLEHWPIHNSLWSHRLVKLRYILMWSKHCFVLCLICKCNKIHTTDKGLYVFPQLELLLRFSTCMRSQYLYLIKPPSLLYPLCKCVLNICVHKKNLKRKRFWTEIFYSICRCFSLVSTYVQICTVAKI